MAKRKRRGFGQVRRLPSKKIQAFYTGPDTRIHNAPATFDTFEDAEAWLTDERRLISAGNWTPPAERHRARYARGQTLAEYAAAWLPRHRRSDGRPLKARTVEHYQKLLDSKILPSLGDQELKKLTESDIADWHEGLGKDTPTLNAHAYTLLNGILRAAAESGVIAKNPCKVRGAARTKTSREVEPATIDELEVIVANMKPEYRLAVLLMAWCALRYGEAAELRRSDVDLRRGRIRVQRGVVLVGGQRQITTPKSDAGIRWAVIPPHIIPNVRQHLDEHVGPRPDELLFTGRDGGHLPWSTLAGKQSRTRIAKGRIVRESASGFRKAAEVAGRPDLTLHALRHTGLTMAAQAGATLAELKEIGGQSTIAAVERYQHAARNRQQVIADRLSEMAGAQ